MSKAVRDYINATFSMGDVWYECFGVRLPYGKCFCPFHDNTDSPAAKVYDDHLTCFGACQRSYFPYDFLVKFRPDLVRSCSSTILPEPEVVLEPSVLCRYGRSLSIEELMLRVLGI